MRPLIFPRRRAQGFSLIELLIATLITGMLLLLLTTFSNAVRLQYKNTRDTAGQFREARIAFDTVVRNLSQATLAPHWDYRSEAPASTPGGLKPLRFERYERLSELHFFVDTAENRLGDLVPTSRTHVLAFQAPLGESEHPAYRPLRTLLAGRVYFLEFDGDEEERPLFLDELDGGVAARQRYRLMEYRPPADRNVIYADGRGTDGTPELDRWYRPEVDSGDEDRNPYVRVLAENIVAFVVSPRNARNTGGAGRVFDLAPGYTYDSQDPLKGENQPEETKNLLPPLVHVTMVAISEEAAQKLELRWGEVEPPPLAFDEGWFTETANYYRDLRKLENQLLSNEIEHRIFSASVRIRSSQFPSVFQVQSGTAP